MFSFFQFKVCLECLLLSFLCSDGDNHVLNRVKDFSTRCFFLSAFSQRGLSSIGIYGVFHSYARIAVF